MFPPALPPWTPPTVRATPQTEASIKIKKAKPRCSTCDKELCPDLDAYYGRDKTAGSKCSKCRERKAA